MKILQLTKTFFQKINQKNGQNLVDQNPSNNRFVKSPAPELETEDTLPWWWFGSETQLREDWDYSSKTAQVSDTDIKLYQALYANQLPSHRIF
ncbi:hypothetical protein ACP6PL_18325 [Dapis sp. BLCC M126]|uniref:hypothetical protein n=1 Tax=Dapis sp. BLCC M126 TaxID=3400189 RepID=UPI003CEDE0EF